MMREVSLETLPNVNIRDPNHDKNDMLYTFPMIIFIHHSHLNYVEILSMEITSFLAKHLH